MIYVIEQRPARVFHGDFLGVIEGMTNDEFLDFFYGDYASLKLEAELDRYADVRVHNRSLTRRTVHDDSPFRRSCGKDATLRSWRKPNAIGSRNSRKATARKLALRLQG